MKNLLLLLCFSGVASALTAQIEYSQFTDPTGNVTTSSSGVCLGCSVANLSNVADNDHSNYATFTIGTALVGYTRTIRAKLPYTQPGSSFAGFFISSSTLVGALPLVTLSTYKAGALQDVVMSNGSLLSLVTASTGIVCGQTNTTKDYDEVGITFTSAVATVGMSANIYWAYGGTAACPSMSTVLPLGLTGLTLVNANGLPRIKWNDPVETPVSFAIQKSTDARHFREVGRVSSADGENGDFIFTDNAATDSASWYRIAEIDQNGGMKYSQALAWSNKNAPVASALRIYPNPVGQSFTLETPATSSNCTLSVYTLQGQQVEMQELANTGGSVAINLQHNLPAGLYVLQLNDKSNNKTYRGKMLHR